jgi:hypothetical protein
MLLNPELVIKETVELEIPEKCDCGFVNLKIYGTRTNGILKIDVRCMRCGKPLVEVQKDERV